MGMAIKKNDRFMNNNESLPINITLEYTPEQMQELYKCSEDVLYFAENYFHIINLDEGRQKIKLYPAQKKAITTVIDSKMTIVCASRQVGKLLAMDTPVPSPTGWTTMGELKDGDIIFDWNGDKTTVVKAHEPRYSKQPYKITFSNGEEIIAGEEHEWFTQSREDRRKGLKGTVKTTQQIKDTLTCGKKEPEPNHRILIHHNTDYDEKILDIDPYLFGYWLGDGGTKEQSITVGAQDIEDFKINFSYIENKNISQYAGSSAYTVRILKDVDGKSFKGKLKDLGVYGNKHIPRQYIESSKNQRLELLQGLMDSDGYCNSRGTCQFYTTIPEMRDSVSEILNSMGIQHTITSKFPKLNGITHKECFILTFKTQLPVFRLNRKKERLNRILRPKTEYGRNDYIYIKSIEEVPQQLMRCITVDNPDQMYLIGRKFVSTKNTTLMTIICLWCALFNKDYSIAILANKEEQAKEILERIKLGYEELPNWLKSGVPVFTNENVKFTNGSKIFISTTSESGIRGKSVNLLFVDEFAHLQTQIIDPFVKSIMPTISSSEKAKIVLVSTPKGATGKFYEYWSGAEKGNNGWTPVKIHYSDVPGRDEKWIKKAKAAINFDEETWKQEYEIEFLENGTAALNQSVIERLKSMVCPAEFSHEDGDYYVWRPYEPGRIISIGVDVAEGVGQDYTVATVLDITDPTDIQHCATYASNKIQPWVFAEKLNQIARSWGRPFLCIERNKEGATIIDALMNIHNYDNIVNYNMQNDKRGVYQNPGIFCHQNSKYNGIQNMKYFIETAQAVSIYDRLAISEFESFVRKENKTWSARKGFNDDRVMSIIWALIILKKDIAERYLDIHEFDEVGFPLRISDPNQFMADNNIEMPKPIRDMGRSAYTPIFHFGETINRMPDKYSNMMEDQGWTFL